MIILATHFRFNEVMHLINYVYELSTWKGSVEVLVNNFKMSSNIMFILLEGGGGLQCYHVLLITGDTKPLLSFRIAVVKLKLFIRVTRIK